MHDFPVYDFTQEQNGSLHFSSLVGHCKWQSVKKVFSSRKFATIAWLRAVLSVISSSQNYYLQSQHGAEPVEDRRTLHVTLPGVNCTPFKLFSFTVMDWTLSVILLTSAMFKLDMMKPVARLFSQSTPHCQGSQCCLILPKQEKDLWK